MTNKTTQDQNTEAPTEKSFWDKIKSGAAKAGEEVCVLGIKSYLAMADAATPYKHKAILGGALAYFVLPVDVVPDVLVGVGYTDDLGVMAAGATAVGSSITDEHDTEARKKWDDL